MMIETPEKAVSEVEAAAATPAVEERAEFGVDALRRLLGEGWEIVQPELLAKIIASQPVLQGALAARGKQIREAFGLPTRMIIGPTYEEEAVAIDFEGDYSAEEWMEGRYRVLEAWLNCLPDEYDELIVL